MPADAVTEPKTPAEEPPPALFAALSGALPDEWLQVAYLDAAGKVLALSRLTPGGIDTVGLPLRRIIADALLARGCVGLIVAHNHPSGDPAPSKNDISATRRLADIARRLELRVLDHFIIAGERWSSFRALGLL